MGGSFTNLSPVAFMVLAHLLYGNACAKGAGETVSVSFGRKGGALIPLDWWLANAGWWDLI